MLPSTSNANNSIIYGNNNISSNSTNNISTATTSQSATKLNHRFVSTNQQPQRGIIKNVGAAEMISQMVSSSSLSNHHHHINNNSNSNSAALLTNHNNNEDRRTRRPFKPSTVWDHFLRHSDGNVQCIHCGKILKRKDSSTKTMWGHLRAIHFKGSDWTALQKQQNTKKTGAIIQENSTIQFDNCTIDDVNTTTSSAQSWLEKQLGISSDNNSPIYDENHHTDNKNDLLCDDPPLDDNDSNEVNSSFFSILFCIIIFSVMLIFYQISF